MCTWIYIYMCVHEYIYIYMIHIQLHYIRSSCSNLACASFCSFRSGLRIRYILHRNADQLRCGKSANQLRTSKLRYLRLLVRLRSLRSLLHFVWKLSIPQNLLVYPKKMPVKCHVVPFDLAHLLFRPTQMTKGCIFIMLLLLVCRLWACPAVQIFHGQIFGP